MTTNQATSDHFCTKYNITQMSETYPFKLCRVADSKGDLSKPWYVEYYIWDHQNDILKRRRVVLEQKTAKERYEFGKIISKKINEKLEAGAVVNPKPKKKSNAVEQTTPLFEAIKFFLSISEKTTKKRTHQSYFCDLNNFQKFLDVEHPKITLNQFSSIQAIQYLDNLTINGSSNRRRNNIKGTVTTLFNFYIKRKIISENPFSEIGKLNTVARKHAAYSKSDIARIKNECIAKNEDQLWLFISFIYYTAIRPGEELRRLKINDIKDKTILVQAENAKNNRTEHIQIPAAFEKLITKHQLRSYPPNHYIFSHNGPGEKLLGKNYFYNKHVVILKKLALNGQNYDLYSWKHTGVIALYLETEKIELIREHCRHADLATTQKYLRDLGMFTDYTQINKFPEI